LLSPPQVQIGAGTASSTSIGFAWVDDGAGTYVVPAAGGATGNRTITNGSFDLTFRAARLPA